MDDISLEKQPINPTLKLNPIENANYPSQMKYVMEVQRVIWSMNNENKEKLIPELMSIVTSENSLKKFALDSLDYASSKKQKYINAYADAYIKVSQEFRYNPFIESENFNIVLKSKGYSTNFLETEVTVDDVLNIYPPNSICYFVTWDKVEELKKHTADPSFNFNDFYDIIPLIDIAAKYGSIECFKYLLLRGVEPTEDTEEYAIEGGNFEIMQILGQNYQQKFKYKLETAIENHCSTEIIQWLLKNTECEEISMAMCMKFYNIKMALFLLCNSYDINDVYEHHSDKTVKVTSLSMAVRSGLVDFVKILLEKQANINYVTTCTIYLESEIEEGETPLIIACKNDDPDLCKLLIENGADPNKFVYNGERLDTPLTVACSNGYYDVVKVLLSNGSDIDFVVGEMNQDTALTIATTHNYLKIVKLLVGKGANVNKSVNKKRHRVLFYFYNEILCCLMSKHL